ncbi:MAG: hypothetical protein LBM02_02525 [Lachnospiraceae bacterium]|jgi:hypothetical protein|nr:hypothetical protein [Lachnospiraceae bacterium]
MKKGIATLLALALVASFAGTTNLKVGAVPQLTGTSNSQLVVIGDTNDDTKLVLVKTPTTFDFSPASGDELKIGDGLDKTVNASGTDTNFEVMDRRGGTTGYKIIANATDLGTQSNAYMLDATTITMSTSIASTEANLTGCNAMNINKVDGIVLTGGNDSRGDRLSQSVSVNIKKSDTNALIAGTYTGTINYTLADTNI